MRLAPFIRFLICGILCAIATDVAAATPYTSVHATGSLRVFGSQDFPGLAGDYTFSSPEARGGVYSFATLGPVVSITSRGSSFFLAMGVDGVQIVTYALIPQNDGIENWESWFPTGRGAWSNGIPALGVAVSGSFAYVANDMAGLQILNCADLDHPVPQSHVDLPGSALSVDVLGPIACLAAGSAGLQIVDVSNPAAPVRLGEFPTDAPALDVKIRGSIAYLAAGSAGFIAVDISNPALPKLLARKSFSQPILRLDVAEALDRRNIFLAAGTAGVIVLDVVDPAFPIIARTVSVPAGALAVSGGYAVGAGGVQSYPVFPPATIERIGGVPEATYPAKLALRENLAFVASGDKGLKVINLENPSAPQVLATYGTNVADVAVRGDRAYVLQSSRLEILDVANPAVPQKIGTYVAAPGATFLALSGDRVYLGGYIPTEIVNVANPAAPLKIGTIPTELQSFTISGTIGYAIQSYSDFLIFDLTNPDAPVLLSQTSMDGDLVGPWVFGNSLILGGSGGVRLVNVLDPRRPVVYGGSANGDIWHTGGVAGLGDLGFFSFQNENGGITAFDVTNPSRVVARYDRSPRAHLLPFGQLLLAADIDTGLSILDLGFSQLKLQPRPAGPVIEIKGSLGRTYAIEYRSETTPPKTWQTLDAITLTQFTQEIPIPTLTNETQRLYRARLIY